MIVDKTNGYLDEVKAFADKAGRAEQLQKELDYLANYSQQETRCLLYKDFAPYSFRFVMERRADDGGFVYWFNGGLILHSNHDGFGSGAAPTLSTCLNPTDGWAVHT